MLIRLESGSFVLIISQITATMLHYLSVTLLYYVSKTLLVIFDITPLVQNEFDWLRRITLYYPNVTMFDFITTMRLIGYYLKKPLKSRVYRAVWWH